jgi:hypothetical protein
MIKTLNAVRGIFLHAHSVAALLVCSFVAPFPAVAATTTLLNDTFSDGDRTNANLPGSGAWFASGAAATLTADSTGMSFTPGGATAHFVGYIPTVTLTNPGDFVTFTFDFTPSADMPYVAIGFRAALLNSNGATKTAADGGGVAIGNYAGYGGFKTSQLTQTDASASIKRRLGTATATGELIGSTSNVWTSNAFNPTTEAASPATPVRFQLLGGKTYTGTITVTKDDATTVSVTNAWSGNGSAETMTAHDNGQGSSGANSATPVTAFDTVAFGVVANQVPAGAKLVFTKLAVTTNVGGSNAVAPTITTQPVSQTVAPGAAATFTVVATGSPAPTYQWSKGSTAISGATSATYTIPSAQTTDAGTYSVAVTNSAGTLTSSGATLTVSSGNVAPTISTQPANVTVTVGSPATFTVVATGTPAPTYQWSKGSSVISGATSATYTIPTAATGDAGSYLVTVTNSAGSVTSSAATLTVNPSGGGNVAPAISTQPSSTAVAVGASATFTVVATGTPAPTYQWNKGTTAIGGATSATYTIPAAAIGDAGSYTVTVTNTAGSITSTAATLTVNAIGAPTITIQPIAQTVTAGSTAIFMVAASGTPAPTYQWSKGGTAISGATGATFIISNAASANAGSYSVTVTNSAGSVASNAATLTVNPGTPIAARITNMSGRAALASGSDSVAFGLTFGGATKPIVARFAGPALKNFGLTNALVAPKLQLLRGSAVQATNSGWDGTTTSSTAFAQVGAFPFASGSKDAAIISSLAAGQYVLLASSADATSGVGLVEIYDAATTANFADRVTNFSVLARTGAGESTVIAGFAVSGTQSLPVVIRGIGPTLGAFGVAGVADPKIVVATGSQVLATSTAWDGSATMSSAFSRVGAFSLTSGTKDAAIMLALPPGTYTVQLTSESGGSGVGLVEIYDAQ